MNLFDTISLIFIAVMLAAIIFKLIALKTKIDLENDEIGDFFSDDIGDFEEDGWL